MSKRAVLVTGGSGYLGSLVIASLAERSDIVTIALDLREPSQRLPNVAYETSDIRAAAVEAIVARHRPDVVVHLASIVTPGKDSSREFEFSVDVGGTRNLLEACVQQKVRRIIVSSSGAAYGYHSDNPPWLNESDALRGNQSFAYSWHKRLVEEMLADYRQRQPQLEQIVLRIGTILGATVNNQITDLFKKPRLLAIRGSDSPFVFIHDQDVVAAIVHGIDSRTGGIFNVAGDGALTIHEIAAQLNKRCLVLPASLLKAALWLLKRFGMTQYGPEQLDFLRYRPVLDNRRLKEDFGYRPRLSSAQVFDLWRTAQQEKTA